MGQIHSPRPVLLLIAAFSRHDAALEWARAQIVAAAGEPLLSSPRFDFTQTDYYEPQMGAGLRKEFHLLPGLQDPAELPRWKRRANQWEQQLATRGEYAEPRPLNLDPGYLTEAKLVLATTKDRDHRLYLGEGIYGEVTLYYHRGAWQTRPWTYPDFAEPACHAFLDQCRQILREQLRSQSNDNDQSDDQ